MTSKEATMKFFSMIPNPNPSRLLGNLVYRILKKMKNTDFHSSFHNITVTKNLFEKFRNTLGI